jgi:hypothetical protein
MDIFSHEIKYFVTMDKMSTVKRDSHELPQKWIPLQSN